jgi:YHS domain-containing protein
MTHSCPVCKRTFSMARPPMRVVNGKGVYFFCSVTCRDAYAGPTVRDWNSGIEARGAPVSSSLWHPCQGIGLVE